MAAVAPDCGFLFAHEGDIGGWCEGIRRSGRRGAVQSGAGLPCGRVGGGAVGGAGGVGEGAAGPRGLLLAG